MKNGSNEQWKQFQPDLLESVPGEDWYLVYTPPGFETRVGRYCGEHGIAFFMAHFIPAHEPSRKMAFPGYAFCRLSSTSIARLKEQPFVRVIERVYDRERLQEEIGRVVNATSKDSPKLGAGDIVTIGAGPLKGATGIFRKYLNNGRRAVIKLNHGANPEVKIETSSLEHHMRTDGSVRLVTYDISPEVMGQLDVAFRPFSSSIIHQLAKHPELLYEVNSRYFEELVAELLDDMGFDVQLTPPSGDGGRDILAVYKIPVGEILTVVECKRYARDRHIGPDIVRQLLWVADRKDNASKAMIATTTFFTTGAKDLEREYKWRLNLADFDRLSKWLSEYGKWQLDDSHGLWIPSSQARTEPGRI